MLVITIYISAAVFLCSCVCVSMLSNFSLCTLLQIIDIIMSLPELPNTIEIGKLTGVLEVDVISIVGIF